MLPRPHQEQRENPHSKKEKGKREGELKRKATNCISEEWKTNRIEDTRNLVSARIGVLIKISDLQESSQHRPEIRWLPRGDEKFGPPSSNSGRGLQTRAASDKSTAMDERIGQCDGNRVPSNGIDFKQGKSRKKLDKR